MEHNFYSDGTPKKIAWMIEGNEQSKQTREHAGIYKDKITNEQSKYIAYHVGIFWNIGTFRIKNGDAINVMIDSQTMIDHLTMVKTSEDKFIQMRMTFINQLIEQRKLDVKYHLIIPEQNKARKLIDLD